MNSHALAANAYTQTARSVGTPRDVEYQAFQRVTAMLTAASEPDAPFARVAEAVHLNTRLWAALAVDLASDGNGLAPALRAQLLGLAEFSRRHGSKILSGSLDAQTALDDLTTVNASVMRGLRGDGAPALSEV